MDGSETLEAPLASRRPVPVVRWWLRARAALAPEDRRRILAGLYPAAGSATDWWFRFGAMLALSVLIAVIGLATDSDAIIIGAMLIAPMMTPLMGLAAALVMGWGGHLVRSVLAVVLGAAGAVFVAYALTSVLPGPDRTLTRVVLSRTSPNLLDLIVALAAGAAGAYATAREDVSTALPGVAVAVALVPPLAAAGFAFALGRPDLAGGALLLFVTNAVAIVLVASLVLLAKGFVPSGRLRIASWKIRLGLGAAIVATAAVATPLTSATLADESHAATTEAVNQAVVDWLSPYPSLSLTGVSISGVLVTAEVTGSTSPPRTTSLVKALSNILGSSVAVRVQWYQTSSSSASPTSPSLKTSALSMTELRSLVESWLAGEQGGMQIVRLTKSGSSVSVELRGPSAPPPAGKLAQSISKRAGEVVTVAVSWQTGRASAGSGTSSPARTARAVVESWLGSHPGVVLLGVSASTGTVTVDLAGTTPAEVTPDLWSRLEAKLGSGTPVAIDFAQLTGLGS